MAAPATVSIRPFPQLERRARFSTDTWRALYARVTNNELAFRYLNRDYRRRLGELELPSIAPTGERIVKDLKAHGIAFAHFDDLFEASLYNAVKDAFEDYRVAFNEARAARENMIKGKEIIIDTVYKVHHFVPDDPVSDYLSSPLFAGIAARYMNMVPRYIGSSFWHTKFVPTNARQFSQQWHRDYNDRRLVKFFLYLNDVGLENGYFEYLTGAHASGKLGRTFDRIGSDGYHAYPDQKAVEDMVADVPVFNLAELAPQDQVGDRAPWAASSARILCTAKAGTMIFCDTFGIHRGGYVCEGHRDLIMGTYSTNFNVHEPHFTVAPEFADQLTPFMRMAFGID